MSLTFLGHAALCIVLPIAGRVLLIACSLYTHKVYFLWDLTRGEAHHRSVLPFVHEVSTEVDILSRLLSF